MRTRCCRPGPPFRTVSTAEACSSQRCVGLPQHLWPLPWQCLHIWLEHILKSMDVCFGAVFRYPYTVATFCGLCSLRGRKAAWLLQEPVFKALARELSLKEAEPSSGYVAVRMVEHCNTKRAKVHVYGMNWSPKNWGGHNVRPSPVSQISPILIMVHCHRLALNPRDHVRRSDASCPRVEETAKSTHAEQGLCNA